MTEPREAFCDDFLTHMKKTDAWPAFRLLGERIGAKHGPGLFNPNPYNDLRKGKLQKIKYLRAIVSVLLDLAREDISETCDDNKIRRALRQGRDFAAFLRDRGLPVGPTTTPDDALTLVCSNTAGKKDHLSAGLVALGEVLGMSNQVNSVMVPCASPREVEEAVLWMVVACGRQVGGEKLSAERAKKIAERHMQVDLDDYQEKAVRWWRFNRWTVIRPRDGQEAAGICTVLPLRENARHLLLSGQMKSYDCSEKHFECPSSTLLLEACSERPIDLGRPGGKVATRLYLAVLGQCGLLGCVDENRAGSVLKVLSFASSALSFRRLNKFGFQATGDRMQGTDIGFMEREFPQGREDLLGRTSRFAMKIISELVDEPPPAYED